MKIGFHVFFSLLAVRPHWRGPLGSFSLSVQHPLRYLKCEGEGKAFVFSSTDWCEIEDHFFFSVLGIEIRALHLLGKYVSHTPALLFVLLLCWYNIQLYNFHYLLEVGQRQECWKKRDALFLTIFLKIWQHRRCRWLTPVIVATWEAEIRSTMVPGQPRKRFTRPHLNP
jgi:hypothetical protein